jgi:anti-sigma regulatory factor (Ser/Thr protein kinase)
MMSVDDDDWRGLWNPASPSTRRVELVGRLVIYLVTPLALALLFGEIRTASQFGYGYLGAFIIGSSIGASFEILYRFVWPLIVRRQPSWPVRIALHALTIAIAVGAGTCIAAAFGEAVLGWDPQTLCLMRQGAVISTVIISILIITDELKARARQLERREAAHRVAVLRAELGALQARTDPHFLFNSLNAVAALIPDDPELAESLLERLAAVFRYALDAGRRSTVELTDEIEAVTAYLEVESLRLGDRLRWTLDRDRDVDGVHVPPLVLQPLVENAVRHGAGGRQGATEISVSARRRGDDVVLVVEDRGDSTPVPVAGGTGTALADLRARLALVYGERAHLVAAPDASGWRAEVVVPMERA